MVERLAVVDVDKQHEPKEVQIALQANRSFEYCYVDTSCNKDWLYDYLSYTFENFASFHVRFANNFVERVVYHMERREAEIEWVVMEAV